MQPATRYAKSGDLDIAYQVVGSGPRDLVYVPGWISNIEVMWEEPSMERFLRRLASFSRLILFDKRGTGLSSRLPFDQLPTLEERMDDVRAVMDAVGSERATLLGHSEGGNMSILFSVTYPARTEALILASCYAKRIRSDDYPWAPEGERRAREVEEVRVNFGDPDRLPDWIAPSRMNDQAFRNWVARYFRLGSSPQGAASLLEANTKIDTTHLLSSVSVPTLCLYRTDDRDVLADEGRWIASKIAGARFVEVPGADHFLNAQGSEMILDEIEEFVTGMRPTATHDRVVTTVMFTDIVGSTEHAAAMGDRAWSDLLERHHRIVRREVVRHRGVEVDTAGDGFFATFDGPARAIRAAGSIVERVADLELSVRVGLHTGEVEIVGADVAGLAVHIGARIADLAEPSEVLVSRTVKDLVAGSGIEFVERGAHRLKGVPDEWQLFGVGR